MIDLVVRCRSLGRDIHLEFLDLLLLPLGIRSHIVDFELKLSHLSLEGNILVSDFCDPLALLLQLLFVISQFALALPEDLHNLFLIILIVINVFPQILNTVLQARVLQDNLYPNFILSLL